MSRKKPRYDLRRCSGEIVTLLCERYHGYKGSGKVFTYAFCVFERGVAVAVYGWQPPPFGAAKAVAPSCPYSVLSLSRMVAVPRNERLLNHISKPLRRQMRVLIDRGRWPVLLTYSDIGQGHTGHVYKCSGWTKTLCTRRPVYEDQFGARRSCYRNGESCLLGLKNCGTTNIQRWEHRVCPLGSEEGYMQAHGWFRLAIPGKTWKSGNCAFSIQKIALSRRLREPLELFDA